MANDVSIRFGVEGEQSFKSALQAVNAQVKSLDAQLNTAIKEMSNADDKEKALAKTSDLLKEKQETLKTAVDKYNEKLTSQRKELDNIDKKIKENTQAYGENSDQVKKLQVEYNNQAKAIANTETTLAKYNGQLADTKNKQEELKNGTLGIGDNFDEAGKKASIFGQVLSAEVVSQAILNGIKKIAEGIKEIATASASYADDILTLSSTTGLATDTIQEFKYMADLVDVSFETIEGSLTKLTRNMQSAKNGTKTQAEAFEQLGISVLDANGELRDNEEVFYEALEALGKMTNETEKDALAMNIFGKSAKDLNPLIDAGTEKMKELAEEAHEVGYVMSEEALESNGAYQDSLDRIKAQTEALKNSIGSALAPALENIADVFSKVTVAVTKFIQEHEWAIPVIVGVVTALGALAVALSISTIIQTVSKAFGALNVVMNANPIMLVVTLIAGLVTAFITAYQTSDEFRKKVDNAFAKVKEAITSAIEKVKGAVETIKELPQKALTWGRDLINNFISGIKEKIQNLKNAVSNVAQTVKDFLGFSEPKRGPLSNFHTYAPDMMKLYAKGMTDNLGIIENASSRVARAVSIDPISLSSINAVVSGKNSQPILLNLDINGRNFAQATYKNYQNESVRLGESLVRA